MFKQLENLKKQLLEKWRNFENRLLESNTFNILKEKYQSLDILQQKLIKYSSIVFVLIILVSLPFSYFVSSSSYWRDFKVRHNLSLELLKIRQKVSYSVFRYSKGQLKNAIERLIQKYSTAEFKITDQRILLPEEKSIYQMDFNIQVPHLNIKQAVSLGTELNNLSQARLSSITIEENKAFPKHYDVAYRVSAFIVKGRNKNISPGQRQPPSRSRKMNIKKNRMKQNKSAKEKADSWSRSKMEKNYKQENQTGNIGNSGNKFTGGSVKSPISKGLKQRKVYPEEKNKAITPNKIEIQDKKNIRGKEGEKQGLRQAPKGLMNDEGTNAEDDVKINL